MVDRMQALAFNELSAALGEVDRFVALTERMEIAGRVAAVVAAEICRENAERCMDWKAGEEAAKTAVDRARTDDGLRASLAAALLWTRDEAPTAAAFVGGYVYDLADRVAPVVEDRERKAAVRALREAAAECEMKPGSYRVHVAGWLRRLADEREAGGVA